MYTPKQFDEPRIEVMHDLMRSAPLATLVTYSQNTLDANHIPLHLTPSDLPYGKLQGHIARANPLSTTHAQNIDVLAIFHGPQTYISPNWYASKNEGGKVVPTWNYAVVHAYGKLSVIDAPIWLRAQLQALTNAHESAQAHPWQLEDAPLDFTERLLGSIIGIEIEITKLTGKWKVSQNQPIANQASVIDGLKASAQPDAIAMADLVKQWGGTDR